MEASHSQRAVHALQVSPASVCVSIWGSTSRSGNGAQDPRANSACAQFGGTDDWDFALLTSARLKDILYAKSSQRCRLARRAGPDVVQRALEGNVACIFDEHFDGQMHRSTFYKHVRRDHREVVVTSCRLDLCDRCHHWDTVLEPQVAAALRDWQLRIESFLQGKIDQMSWTAQTSTPQRGLNGPNSPK